jgi:hypothetical protein
MHAIYLLGVIEALNKNTDAQLQLAGSLTLQAKAVSELAVECSRLFELLTDEEQAVH